MNNNLSYFKYGYFSLLALGTWAHALPLSAANAPAEEQSKEKEDEEETSITIDMPDLSLYRHAKLPDLIFESKGKATFRNLPFAYALKIKMESPSQLKKGADGNITSSNLDKLSPKKYWSGGLDVIDTLKITYKHEKATLEVGREKGNFCIIGGPSEKVIGKDFSLKIGWHPNFEKGIFYEEKNTTDLLSIGHSDDDEKKRVEGWYYHLLTTSIKLGYKKSSFKVKLINPDFWIVGSTLTIGKSELAHIRADRFLKKVELDYSIKKKQNNDKYTLKLTLSSKEWERNEVKYSGTFKSEYSYTNEVHEFALTPTTFQAKFPLDEKLECTLTLTPYKINHVRGYKEETKKEKNGFFPSSSIGVKLKYTF